MAKRRRGSRESTARRDYLIMILLGFGLLWVPAALVWRYYVAGEAQQPATTAQARELLVVLTKGTSLSGAASTAMLDQLRANNATVNPKVLTLIPAEVDAFFADAMQAPGGLGDAMAPAFARHFTSGEIGELLAFYRSPVGRKLTETMPQVTADTAAVAQRWTLDHWPELSQRVEAALKREGVTLPPKASVAP